MHARCCAGVPVMSLHGKIKQMKRLAIFADFAQRKAACMFATDIAARGLDFPNVDWVVQVDCPDDVEGYIHRVGRSFSPVHRSPFQRHFFSHATTKALILSLVCVFVWVYCCQVLPVSRLMAMLCCFLRLMKRSRWPNCSRRLRCPLRRFL